MPNVIHECPADGSEHTSSPSCSCGPVRTGCDEFGNELWKHRSRAEREFAHAMRELVDVNRRGADALRDLVETMAAL